MPQLPKAPPKGVPVSTLRHRVPFFDTDGMRIVHHANFVRYLELSRIIYLDEHDRPYREYTAQGLHFAVTGLELGYRQAARFDDLLEITAWLEWVRGASLRIGYVVGCGPALLASAATEHAMVDDAGRPRRIPADTRERLRHLVPPS